MKHLHLIGLNIVAICVLCLLSSCDSSDSSSNKKVASDANGSLMTAEKLSDTKYQAQHAFTYSGNSSSVYLYVKLLKDPGTAITVNVNHSSGDPDQVIYPFVSTGGSGHVPVTTFDLHFDASNWDDYQTICFTTQSDTDAQNTAATYVLTSADVEDFIDATVTVSPAPPVKALTAHKIADGVYQKQTLFSCSGSQNSAYMYVKLDSNPGEEVTVDVTRSSGDVDQLIYTGASTGGTGHSTVSTFALTFDETNWDVYQQICFITQTDSDAQTEWATFTIDSDDLTSFEVKDVQAAPPIAADGSVSGTITRSGFQAAALMAFDQTVNDITFTLSWKKVGTGTDARYYGSYSDDDTLNQVVTHGDSHEADATNTENQGNPDRNVSVYPAYGFWSNGKIHFVITKNVVTPRSTAEVNLVVLSADDETFATGTGYCTATSTSTSDAGSYPISFTATENDTENLQSIFPILSEDPDFPVYGFNLQTQSYSPGAIGATNGKWELEPTGGSDYLFSGTASDADNHAAGDIHGFAFASIDDEEKPNVIGVLEEGGNIYVFGLPFYAEPDEDFPMGALGGRFVKLSDGTTDRMFIFLSITAVAN